MKSLSSVTASLFLSIAWRELRSMYFLNINLIFQLGIHIVVLLIMNRDLKNIIIGQLGLPFTTNRYEMEDTI
jgi:hypothetical protein